MADIKIDMQKEQLLSREDEDRVLQRWAPRVYMHPREKWFPLDFDVYAIASHGLNGGNEVVAQAGTLTWDAIHQSQSLEEKLRVRKLDLDDDWIKENEGKQENVKIYGLARRLADGNIVLCYVFNYAVNPNVTVMLAFGAGYHKADIEKCYFILDPSGEELHWSYMTAHGPMEHSWIPASEMMCNDLQSLRTPFLGSKDRMNELLAARGSSMTVDRDAQPCVFVSHNSHAMYWRPGTYWRIFGVTADVCRSDGPVIDARDEGILSVLDYDRDAVMKWDGWMTITGICGPGCPGRLSISLMRIYPSSTISGRQFFFDFVSFNKGFFIAGALVAALMVAAGTYVYRRYFMKGCECDVKLLDDAEKGQAVSSGIKDTPQPDGQRQGYDAQGDT